MYRIEHLIDAMRLARIDSDIDSGERLTGRERLAVAPAPYARGYRGW